jgi:Mg2+-importing ATPase
MVTDDGSPIALEVGSARVPDLASRAPQTGNSAGDPAWWLRPTALLAKELSATADGLSSSEARSRLKRYGPNQVRNQHHRPLVWQFLRRFRNPLVLILVAASIVSALTGDIPSFGIIASMILLSVTLDFVQEHRAGQAAMRLSQSVALVATVVRDGTQKRIRATQVVPGDIVILAAGALVPADGVLLEARDLHVNEALLTGEPFPAEKGVAAPTDATDLVGATNALFMGTSVVSGTGRLLVYRTGVATAMGDVSRSLNAQAPATAFELGIRRFGMLIMRLTVLMVLFVLMVNAVEHKPLWESFLFAVALAVGLTPELLRWSSLSRWPAARCAWRRCM